MDATRKPWTPPMLTELSTFVGAERLAATVDIANHHLVTCDSQHRIEIGNPPSGPLSVPEALAFAAWIVAISGRETLFNCILDRIEQA